MRVPKRHPADVTADRLVEHYEKFVEHYEKWFYLFTQSERDYIDRAVNALREIADGTRAVSDQGSETPMGEPIQTPVPSVCASCGAITAKLPCPTCGSTLRRPSDG